jgi:hypothetical protein
MEEGFVLDVGEPGVVEEGYVDEASVLVLIEWGFAGGAAGELCATWHAALSRHR